ncbi:histidine kinase [Stenotrophomonas sp.]|uniref:sensor histidine kinase n=1 Tax=Stenotrophomonas sp. TaxID=69392 RepID=UPI0028A7C7D9|nr:histidine kinase [Stenotrophomonas sp.]
MTAASKDNRPGWQQIAAGWLLLALVTLPAVQLTSDAGTTPFWSSLGRNFVFLLGIQLPWVLATPGLLRLCRRWPLGMDSDTRVIGQLLLVGLPLIPTLSLAGWVLGHGLSHLPAALPLPAHWPRAVLATSLFALPTYFAVIGIGQTLAYIQRYRRRGELLAQVREQALASRLNHHFLFNALNAIGSLGYRDAARADAALAQLGELLRTLLDNAAIVPLREEVSNAMAFVELQQLLQDRPIALQLQADPDAWQAMVPSLLLQPFIENALRFAQASTVPDAAITLSMTADDGILQIVIGNPCGSAPPGRGIGVDASRQRLHALHGSRASVDVNRAAGHCHTRIRLPMPARREAA